MDETSVRFFVTVRPYVQIARIDHWFKNAFMLVGALLAIFYDPSLFAWTSVAPVLLAFVVTCLIASSNYALNEALDASSDVAHPVKRHRPVPSGRVTRVAALIEWCVLGVAGVAVALAMHPRFAAAALTFFLAGFLYNVPPFRTKEIPYLDVLSEALNSPIRLFLGWFALIPNKVPPLSLVLAYWMAGAFFMATKRYAECRAIRDGRTLTDYRRSFAHYTEERLLVSMFFYALTSALFSGIFIVRYHAELILLVPLGAGFLTYYFKLGLEEDSSVQNPEKLLRRKPFVAVAALGILMFVLLMFTRIPVLYDLFNIAPPPVDPLWTIGPASE